MTGITLSPLLAVHLPDGVLTPAWWIGGFAVAAAMALFGAWRMRDEEIPRVALLTAAFFVVSLIHVPVPAGAKAHLLLNGLLGVILGRRAGLAIPMGLFLQAALFQYGGYTTLGINSCVMGLPALLAWVLFAGLRRVPWVRQPWFRAGLVAASTALLVLSLVYSVTVLATNPLRELQTLDTSRANQLTFNPLTLAATLLLAALAAWVERRLKNSAEFPLGLLIGEVSVLATIFLWCLVLLCGGMTDLHTMALLTLVVHLPLAILEGIILGFTVGFLVRVKPEMIGWDVPATSAARAGPPVPSANGGPHNRAAAEKNGAVTHATRVAPPNLLLAVGLLLLASGTAQAHRLNAQGFMQPDGRIQIECWFPGGETPKGAKVKVFGANDQLLEEGQVDDNGIFVFSPKETGAIRVVVDAGLGHVKELTFTAEKVIPQASTPTGANAAPAITATEKPVPLAERTSGISVKDVLVGIGFLLALGAFGLSLRNARQLRELNKTAGARDPPPV